MIRQPYSHRTLSLPGHRTNVSRVVSQQTSDDIQAALSALQFPSVDSDSTSQNAKNRWMLPYADLMTLLLGLFLVMFASQIPPNTASNKYQSLNFTGLLSNLTTQLEAADPDFKQTADAADIRWALSDLKLTANVSTQGQKTTLSFDEQLFFAPGEARLSPSAKQAVRKLADVLKTTHGHIRVEGHTDNTPIRTATYPSNWELSTMRATVILRELIETHQFDPREISAAGYGEFSPIADNTSEAGRRRNRRVDIVIENTTDDIQPTARPEVFAEPQVQSRIGTVKSTENDKTGVPSHAQTN